MQPTNPLVNALLTDLYQFRMAYAYWKNGMQDRPAVFDLFFRKCPFAGEFAVFAGLEEALRFVESYKITGEHIRYLKKVMPGLENEFFEWLMTLDCSKVKIYAPREGTLIFPKIPVLRVEGSLAIVQLLETTLLNQINFATLMATNAARFRLAAGWDKTMMEFGLRRAQGADGAITAARSSYIGGFDGTSNVLAGFLFDIPVFGTHAHSFVTAFTGREDLVTEMIFSADKTHQVNLWEAAKRVLDLLGYTNTNEGELAAYCAFAQAFPSGFLALVDTYDTEKSGVPNFLAVAIVLHELGYRPVGIRLDSGDLAYLSKRAKEMFSKAGETMNYDLSYLKVSASNDIEESILYSLQDQGAQIDTFGIGTHLVTCQSQPALGGVYKLVLINGIPRIKLSQDIIKVTLPGKKSAYRIFIQDAKYPVIDLIIAEGEEPPKAGEKFLCHSTKNLAERAFVTPSSVTSLNICQWDGKRVSDPEDVHSIRAWVIDQLKAMRPDFVRAVNPTPYKVAISSQLYEILQSLLVSETPIGEIKG